MASLPSIPRIFEFLSYDSFPLLSTLVLRGWIHAGLGSDQGLRVYGFLVGGIVLGALWLTCRFLRCPTPLISLALVGLNPWVVRTADSIRPYGLGIALVLVTLGCVWKAVETSGRRWFILAGLLAILSVQCMYQNTFLILAICLGGAFVSLRESRVKAAVGAMLVGLAAAISLLLYIPSITEAQSWGVLVRRPSPVSRLVEQFFEALAYRNAANLWLWLGLAVLSGVVGLQALLSRGQRAGMTRSNLALFCATVLVVAAVAYLTAMKAAQLLTQPWYFVPLIVMVASTLDASIWLAATTNWARILRLAVVSTIACMMAISGWRHVHERLTNVDLVAANLGKQATAEDTIVLFPFWIGTTFQRYYKGPAKWVTIPPLEDVNLVRFDLVKAAMAHPNPLASVIDTNAKTLQSGHRVFWVQALVVKGSGPPTVVPPAPLPKTGWYLAPYLFSWPRQAAYPLESHCLRVDPGDAPTGGRTVGYEDATVTIISGWH